MRRLPVLAVLAVAAWWLISTPASAAGTSVSRAQAVQQLQNVRRSIDVTLDEIKSGDAKKAFDEAKAGYLNHFEFVEIPLRIVDPGLTADAETKFAEIRGLISGGAPVGEVRDSIVELRRLIDNSERKLTSTGVGAPTGVAGQACLSIFREGVEDVGWL
jgi:high-affinity iron transporter